MKKIVEKFKIINKSNTRDVRIWTVYKFPDEGDRMRVMVDNRWAYFGEFLSRQKIDRAYNRFKNIGYNLERMTIRERIG